MSSSETDKSGPTSEPKAGELLAQLAPDIFRFLLASLLIGGFLAILIITLVGGYAEIDSIAGIFSGWIVAIIAFYFMDQAADRTQRAVATTNKAEGRLTESVNTGFEKAGEVENKANETISQLKKQRDEALKKAEKYLDALKQALALDSGP